MKLVLARLSRVLPIPWHLVRSAWREGTPFKATLAVTTRCPYRCSHCGVFRHTEPELSARELADTLAGLDSLFWIDVTGGEVLEREDCCELVSRLDEQLPGLALFHFPTSGHRPAEAEALARHAVRLGLTVVVSVSIDGPEDLHDRLRGKPGAFRSAVETLSRLRAVSGVHAYAGTTLLPENVDTAPAGVFDAIRKACPGLTPSDLHVNVMQRSDHYFDNRQVPLPSREQVRRALARTIRLRGVPKGPFALLELAYQGVALAMAARPSLKPPACAALRSSFFLSPSGRVHPCHIWGEAVGRAAPDAPVRELLRSGRCRWLRSLVANASCPRCWTPCEAYPTMIDRMLDPARLQG